MDRGDIERLKKLAQETRHKARSSLLIPASATATRRKMNRDADAIDAVVAEVLRLQAVCAAMTAARAAENKGA